MSPYSQGTKLVPTGLFVRSICKFMQSSKRQRTANSFLKRENRRSVALKRKIRKLCSEAVGWGRSRWAQTSSETVREGAASTRAADEAPQGMVRSRGSPCSPISGQISSGSEPVWLESVPRTVRTQRKVPRWRRTLGWGIFCVFKTGEARSPEPQASGGKGSCACGGPGAGGVPRASMSRAERMGRLSGQVQKWGRPEQASFTGRCGRGVSRCGDGTGAWL